MAKAIMTATVTNPSALVAIWGEQPQVLVRSASALQAMKGLHEVLPQGKTSAYIFNAMKEVLVGHPFLNWSDGDTSFRFEVRVNSPDLLVTLRETWKSASGPFRDLVAILGKEVAKGTIQLSLDQVTATPAPKAEDEIPF